MFNASERRIFGSSQNYEGNPKFYQQAIQALIYFVSDFNFQAIIKIKALIPAKKL